LGRASLCVHPPPATTPITNPSSADPPRRLPGGSFTSSFPQVGLSEHGSLLGGGISTFGHFANDRELGHVRPSPSAASSPPAALWNHRCQQLSTLARCLPSGAGGGRRGGGQSAWSLPCPRPHVTRNPHPRLDPGGRLQDLASSGTPGEIRRRECDCGILWCPSWRVPCETVTPHLTTYVSSHAYMLARVLRYTCGFPRYRLGGLGRAGVCPILVRDYVLAPTLSWQAHTTGWPSWRTARPEPEPPTPNPKQHPTPPNPRPNPTQP
jgi:hypothetical protein